MVEAIRGISLDLPEGEVGLTCSAGIVNPAAVPSVVEINQVLELADRALYQAKRSGRNCAVSYSTLA